jgi:hypothetical protein
MVSKQCCGSGRIRTFLVGSGYERLGPDPDPDTILNKWPYINFFGVCKRHKYFRNLCLLTFWFMTIPFRAYFCQKQFQKLFWPKIYLGQDPDTDPDVFESRIRIRSKIVRIRNTG